MNIFERFQGVFTSPKRTLEGVAAKPVWVDAFIIILIVLAVYTYLVSPITNKESLAMVQNSAKLQERMGKERFDKYVEAMSNPSPTRRLITSFAVTPLTSAAFLLIQALFLLIFGRMTATAGTFREVLAVYFNASFIDKVLGRAVILLINLSRKSVFQTTTSVALLFPKMAWGSVPYVILAQLDFFQLWMFGVLAYGLAAVFKVELKKALIISYSFFAVKALINVILFLLSRSMMGL